MLPERVPLVHGAILPAAAPKRHTRSSGWYVLTYCACHRSALRYAGVAVLPSLQSDHYAYKRAATFHAGRGRRDGTRERARTRTACMTRRSLTAVTIFCGYCNVAAAAWTTPRVRVSAVLTAAVCTTCLLRRSGAGGWLPHCWVQTDAPLRDGADDTRMATRFTHLRVYCRATDNRAARRFNMACKWITPGDVDNA